MTYDCEITLITVKAKLDENGVPETDEVGNLVELEMETTVFAELKKIGQKEFYAGAQSGLRPEKMAKLWSWEYAGQVIAVVDGIRYSIYRTFGPCADEKTELYLTLEGGTVYEKL